MIKKTIISAILIFIVWTLFIALCVKKSVSLYLWQETIVNAENYLYLDSNVTNVIIGTSLSRKLEKDSLPAFYKLSFSGLGIFDGFEVIAARKELPRNVFVETNLIFKKQNEDFKRALFYKGASCIKTYLPSLKESKEPLPLAANYILIPVIKKIYLHGLYLIPKLFARVMNHFSSSDKKTSYYNNIFQKMLDMKKKEFSEPIDSSLFNSQVNLLRYYVALLKGKGVNIVFFEMPVNPALINMQRPVETRAVLYKYFPPAEYNYIPLPDDYATYITGDGEHLTYKEIGRYSSFFKAQTLKYCK